MQDRAHGLNVAGVRSHSANRLDLDVNRDGIPSFLASRCVETNTVSVLAALSSCTRMSALSVSAVLSSIQSLGWILSSFSFATV